MGEKVSSVKVIKFIEKNQEKLYRMAFSYMKNEQDALDAVHNAIVKILQNKAKIRRIEYFETWAYRVLINECLMMLRKNKKMVIVDDETLNNTYDITYDKTCESDDYIDLYNSMDKLSSKLKTVVMLRFFEDMKLDEISRITGDNVSTVKTRLYKALRILKLDLEVEHEDK